MYNTHSKWPICFSELLAVGNKNSCIGIITLWSEKEIIMQHLQKKDYALIGQLYSRQGINAVIRNCLANKAIRYLILVGKDRTGSGEVLLSFFKKGINKANYAVNGTDIFIDKEIPYNSLEILRKNVFVHHYPNLNDFSQLPKLLQQLPSLHPYGEDEFFPAAHIIPPLTYPSEQAGFLVSHDFVGAAWLEILCLINRFGCIKKSEHGVEQRELLNIVSLIKKENPDEPVLYPYFQFTKNELFSYYPQIISSTSLEGIEYSYGQRFRAHKNIDQIQTLIASLQKRLYSRRALAVTWDIEKDTKSKNPPCLILADFLVQNNQLYLTAFFRSNDMFHAWPLNVFGLRKLQFFVAEKLKIISGILTVISSSAHIYQNNWKQAQEILSNYSPCFSFVGDCRGNLIIRVSNDKIIITHTSPEGKQLDEFSGTNIDTLYKKLLEEHRIGTLSHALYIGSELQKAAIALQKGIPYVQDKELEV